MSFYTKNGSPQRMSRSRDDHRRKSRVQERIRTPEDTSWQKSNRRTSQTVADHAANKFGIDSRVSSLRVDSLYRQDTDTLNR